MSHVDIYWLDVVRFGDFGSRSDHIIGQSYHLLTISTEDMQPNRGALRRTIDLTSVDGHLGGRESMVKPT